MPASGSATAKVAPTIRSLVALVLGPALALGSVLFSPVAAAPAQAAVGDLVCGSGYIYAVRDGGLNVTENGDLIRVNTATGAAAAIGNFGSGTGVKLNALGISGDGGTAYAISDAASGAATVYTWRNSDGSTTATPITGLNTSLVTIKAGAVDPSTGTYWLGAGVGSAKGEAFYLYEVNLSTGKAVLAATTTWLGKNADMAFDAKGNLYLAISSTADAGALREIKAGDLSGTNPTYTTLADNLPKSQYPGVAFASDGYLYMSLSGATYSTLSKFNPTSGASISSQEINSYGRFFADLGSCATPTVMDAVQKKVVGRKATGDQFTVSLSGNGVPSTATATTTGANTTVATDSVLVLPGLTYTIAETASGTAALSDYVSTYDCVDANTGTSFASGSATSATVTMPPASSGGHGANATCTFTNEVKNPAISITKNASGSPAKAGDTITYSFTVKNTGNRPLTGVSVADPMLGKAPTSATITCAATALAVGASTNCSASAACTVTQADVEAGTIGNTATVSANPPNGEGAAGSVTATGAKTVTITQTAKLKIEKNLLAGDPYKVGDQLTYGFTVTNTGNVTVSSVGVKDDLVTGEDCKPTTLAPGAAATCTANAYTVTAADVATGTVVNTADPTGTSVAGTPVTDPSSTRSVTTRIGTLPVATPNTASTKQNFAVILNPLTDDTAGRSGAGTVGTLVPGSMKLVAGPGDSVSTDGTYLTNANGTYLVSPATGHVTFVPAKNYVGTAQAITYQVTDSLGLTASSTIQVTVTPITPKAHDDADSTSYLTPKTVNVMGNDDAGDASVPLVATSVKIFDPSTGNFASSATVAGQGTYTVDPVTGAVTFAPAYGFSGPASPILYQVADKNTTTTTALLTMTVDKPVGPSAADDSTSALQGSPATVVAKTGDTAGGKATLQDNSVTLEQSGGSFSKDAVDVTGKGTWTVADDGTVTFTPLPGFTGTVSIGYSIADELGQTAKATITVTINPSVPDAEDDANHGAYGQSVTTAVLTNDKVGPNGAAITEASVALRNPDTGTYAASLGTADGSYTVTADHTITFVPNAGFHGEVTEPVTYRIEDVNGATDTATLTVTIGNPPSADDESATTPQNVDVVLDLLDGDLAGDDGAGVRNALDPATVHLVGADAGSDGHKLTVAGEGVYTVNPANGKVTFDPEPTFHGPASKVTYTVTDSYNNTATATISVMVNAVTPVANDDTNHAPYGTASVTTDVLNGDPVTKAGADAEGAASVPLDPTSVEFADGTKSLTNTDGTYTIDPATGVVTFAPAAGFSGDATPVAYRVSDSNGTTATATLAVTIGKPPLATPDTGSTPQNVPVTVSILGNDKAGDDGSLPKGLGIRGTLLPGSVTFTSAAAKDAGRTLTTAEGVWTIDAVTGAVTFTPNASYTGETKPVDYSVTDSYGNTAASTVQITVAAITPKANDNANHTAYKTPVTTDVLGGDPAAGGDAAGAASAPLVPSSVVITTPGATDEGKKLVVDGEGTWTVDGDGDITFAPSADFHGGPAKIAYQVSDKNGTPASANLTVTVGAPPSADDETGTTLQNTRITLDLLNGDLPGDDGADHSGTWKASSLVFSDGSTTLKVEGQGTYTIDQATGKVAFQPIPSFTGEADAVTYQVTDSFGNTATATIDITVTALNPKAGDDAATTPYQTAKTIDVLANDHAAVGGPALDPSTVVIVGATRGTLATTDGTWKVESDGEVTFTPKDGFSGDAVITYQVKDTNGTVTEARVTVTVPKPAAPQLVDDAANTPYLTPVTTSASLLANDNPGALTTLQVASLQLHDTAHDVWVTDLTVDGEGRYQVDTATGKVIFTPAAGFSGTVKAPVTYRVDDELGQTGTATLTITVGAPPTANDNSATTDQGIAVNLHQLGNDAAGTSGTGASGTLVKTAVVFTSDSATDDGKTLVVANQGTWTIDSDGEATFTPLKSFHGEATAVQYQVTDSFGNTATAMLNVHVTQLTPTADDNAGHGEYGASVKTDVLANDSATGSATLRPGSVVILDPNSTDGGKKLAVADQGVWTVNSDGTITFAPHSGFHGTAEPVTYQVSDSNDTPVTAKLTVTIGNPPSAANDAATTPYRRPVTLTPLGNDLAGDDGAGARQALDPATVLFTSAEATDGDRRLVTEQGSWTIDAATGIVAFAPAATFSGPTTSVEYQVIDNYGHVATAFLTVTVGAPPSAVDDSATTPQNVPVTLKKPFDNDSAGDDGAGNKGTLDETSVVFTSSKASPDGKSLVTADGTWTIDPTSGEPTFDPNPDFVGTTSKVGYEVTDSFGHTATANWTVTVAPLVPVAVNDTNSGPFGAPVVTDVLHNDQGAAASAPLVPGSVVILTDGSPAGVTSLDVPGKGSWNVDPVTGAITFTPVPGYHGSPDPVTYQVSDTNGTAATATLTVTIGKPPSAATDSATTPQNTPVSLDPLANDAAGSDGTPALGSLVPASVVFTTAGASPDGKKLVLGGTGTFTVDATTGKVTFTPEPTFTGAVPVVTYRVTDSFGNTTEAGIRVTVSPVVPAAANDATSAPYGSPVTVDILGNDQPGDSHTRLDPSTLVFTDTAATDGGKVLVVSGEGTWRINSDGTVTFTPAEGFSGSTTPVKYRIADANGTYTTASVVVRVAAGPAASDDQVRGAGSTVTVQVLTNDAAGDGATVVAGSVRLLGMDGKAAPSTKLVVSDQGTWTVGSDGRLTFVGLSGFHGWTSWVTYQFTDSNGHVATARARVWVPQATGEDLAYTGAEVGTAITWGLLLLGAGFVLVVGGSRRRRGQRYV